MKPLILFDDNETLLDMGALDGTFGDIFGAADPAAIRTRWFKQVLELFLTNVATGEHRAFASLADDALRMIAEQQRREIAEHEWSALKAALAELPAHPDVVPGLDRLQAAGFRLAALTNSGREAATKLLRGAGLLGRLEQVLSAEDVQRHKPAREAYAHAARSLGVALGDIVLVAAHSWDVAGALAAGCQAAFVARPGQALSPGVPAPRYRGRDVAAVAEQIAAAHGG